MLFSESPFNLKRHYMINIRILGNIKEVEDLLKITRLLVLILLQECTLVGTVQNLKNEHE